MYQNLKFEISNFKLKAVSLFGKTIHQKIKKTRVIKGKNEHLTGVLKQNFPLPRNQFFNPR